jgi:hypothetical protein
VIVVLLCFCFAAGAIEPGIRIVKVQDVVHSISVEKLDRTPPFIVIKDSFDLTQEPLSQVGVSLSFTEAGVLRSLVINVTSDASFIPSGEIVWRFSTADCLPLYCTPHSKMLQNGRTEYTLTYLGNLAELYKRLSNNVAANPLLELYSKKSTIQRLILPSEFFKLISELAGKE